MGATSCIPLSPFPFFHGSVNNIYEVNWRYRCICIGYYNEFDLLAGCPSSAGRSNLIYIYLKKNIYQRMLVECPSRAWIYRFGSKHLHTSRPICVFPWKISILRNKLEVPLRLYLVFTMNLIYWQSARRVPA